MKLFDIFKKKEKTYICARCKKEIKEEETHWIGNHRFCKDCAASPKATSAHQRMKPAEEKEPEHVKKEKTYICARCKKEITEEETNWIGNHRFCKSCAASPKASGAHQYMKQEIAEELNDSEDGVQNDPGLQELIEHDKQNQARVSHMPEGSYAQEIDSVVEKVLSQKSLHLLPDAVDDIKRKATIFLTNYNANDKYSYIFYWQEYPMGATHSKEFMKIDSVWCVCQYDYDKKPPLRQTAYPNITDENLLEGFLEVLITENNYPMERICLLYHEENEYERYHVELRFCTNGEISVVDTYWWPVSCGASNGGERTTKLAPDYFAKNTIDDFIGLLTKSCSIVKKFNKDFSMLKVREDVISLFGK